MTASADFLRTLYAQPNSVTEEFYERGVGSVFDKEDDDLRLECWCWSGLTLREYTRIKQASAIASCQVIDDAVLETAQVVKSDTEFNKAVSPSLSIIDLDVNKLARFIQVTSRQFRIFFIRQDDSHSRLQISKEVFAVLAGELQLYPQLREFLVDFKWKLRETEVGPPRINFRPLSSSPSQMQDTSAGFECAYIVRFIEFTNREGEFPWSLRQYVVYHKYSPEEATHPSTWMLFGSSQRTESCIKRYSASGKDMISGNPFELHVLFLDIAIASWRPYLIEFHDAIADLSEKAFIMEIGKGDSFEQAYTVDVQDYQSLKEIEDRGSDVLLCLDSTLDTVTTIRERYTSYPLARDGLKQEDIRTQDEMLFALEEQRKSIQYSRKKVEALLSKAEHTRALISSLLDRLNGHNLDQQMVALQSLQRQAQDENAIMRELAEQGSRDSASVRILTILTLIYLPCTVVSSFYSTQFVDKDKSADGQMKMKYADNAWLFFAVSIPLTFFTIMVWYSWANSRALYRAVVLKHDEGTAKIRKRVKGFNFLGKSSGLPR
ncbi:hypothetical protein HBI25_052550 [Parastagonospora nodorum]|nr:hypothetical protein HBI25_052550 [Parastagonospora nodorum]